MPLGAFLSGMFLLAGLGATSPNLADDKHEVVLIHTGDFHNQIEAAASGSLEPDVATWPGGWLFNFSGVTMDFNPHAPNNARASNARIHGQPLDLTRDYTYASYWYAADPA